jgi:Tfp pilus assembly PilM family ATPase
MSQTILGIDLGSYSVKVLRVARHVQEIEILDFIEEPLSPHSRLSHEEQVRIPLEKILANSAMKADVVCASFPGYHLSSRVLELPFTNQKKISQVIDFEIEGQIPFPSKMF